MDLAAVPAAGLRVAFLHWPQGDDKAFFLRLVREACGSEASEVSAGSRPDVVFASLFADRPVFDAWRRANASVPLIFWFGENTAYPSRRHRSYEDYCLAQADLVLGFKRAHLGLPNYARLPYWLVSRMEYFEERGRPLSERFSEHAGAKKTRFASLIARADHTGLRGWLMRLLSHVGAVFCPSSAYRNVPPGEELGEGWAAKRRYTASCLFSICPENSFGDGYTTEKPFDALLCGAWPVYCGEQPCEPEILRQECIIFADPSDVPATVERLAACLDAPPPTLAGAMVPGGELAIDRMLQEAISKVGAAVRAGRGGAAAAGVLEE